MTGRGGPGRAPPASGRNTNRDVRGQSEKRAQLARAGAVGSEIFPGIDTAAPKHVMTRLIPGEGAKPAEAMNTESLVARVAGWVKTGVAVHGVDEAGPPRPSRGVARHGPGFLMSAADRGRNGRELRHFDFGHR